jgi:protein-tyrosine phosphatase
MGMVDLHCHLIPGVDDGARTLEDAVQMARVLVGLGFNAAAPSPHNRPQYAPREAADAGLRALREALAEQGIPLELATNAENDLMDERFVPTLGTAEARLLGAGKYVLVEAPYTSPVPALREMIFRVKVKGVTPLIAHPERCLEFQRPARAAEAVAAGALLQLDIGALIGRYGPEAKKVARTLLDEGLYAVGATDVHSPVGAEEWVGQALQELCKRAGGAGFDRMMSERPGLILRGEPVES